MYSQSVTRHNITGKAWRCRLTDCACWCNELRSLKPLFALQLTCISIAHELSHAFGSQPYCAWNKDSKVNQICRAPDPLCLSVIRFILTARWQARWGGPIAASGSFIGLDTPYRSALEGTDTCHHCRLLCGLARGLAPDSFRQVADQIASASYMQQH